MDAREFSRELGVILIATLVLAFSVSYGNNKLLLAALISFFVILAVNILAKKLAGYFFEIDVESRFWTWRQFGFRTDMHFKKAIPMVWLPLLLSLFSRGAFWWLAIVDFDFKARPERVSKRHGLYRFTQVTEWHVAWIALWGIIANVFFAFAAYFAGFEFFSKLSIYFALWSVVPLSSLDGSKILFSSRALWAVVASILVALFFWVQIVI